MILTLNLGPPTIVHTDGEPVRPDRGAITSPGKHLRVSRAANSAILILRAKIDAVEEPLQEIMGRAVNNPIESF